MADYRVCIVDSDEDFTLAIVTDQNDSSMDVEIVECGRLADYRVRLVPADSGDAAETARVIEGASGWNDGEWDDGEWNE